MPRNAAAIYVFYRTTNGNFCDGENGEEINDGMNLGFNNFRKNELTIIWKLMAQTKVKMS